MRHYKIKLILKELLEHLPYSLFGVVSAILIMGFLSFLSTIMRSEELLPKATEDLFHLFHPTHILFSALVTTTMFWKHDNRNLLKAVLVGIFGSIPICALSDIFLPFIGGLLLGYPMHVHICIIEEPIMILTFAFIGVIAGLVVNKQFEKSTQFSHSIHIFLSSCASLLYLIGFGITDWMHQIAGVFIVTVFAVMIPCCTSDIVFPILCTHKYCDHSKEKEV